MKRKQKMNFLLEMIAKNIENGAKNVKQKE
jgi:hypothetical protein